MKQSGWNASDGLYRHNKCCVDFHTVSAPRETSLMRSQLQVQATCRQLYTETHCLPYTSSIFSFNLPCDVVSFIEAAPGSRYLRSIRLQVLVGDAVEHWAEAMRKVVEHMKCIDEVHLDILQYHVEGYEYWGPETEDDVVYEAFACLAELPLRVVTVIIKDDYDLESEEYNEDMDVDGNLWLERGRWTLGQKQKWSSHFRRVLLRK